MLDDIVARDRAAARFISAIWKHAYRADRRHPPLDRVLASAEVNAKAILNAHVGNRFRFLNAPQRARCRFWQDLSANGGSRPSRQLADEAHAALAYLHYNNGDNPKANPRSVATDRLVWEMFVEGSTDRAIGRQLDMTHTSVRDRRSARAARIGQQLHEDCPDLWSPTGKPLATKVSDKLISRDEETALLLAA